MQRVGHFAIEACLGLALGYSALGTADFLTSFPPPAQLTWDAVRKNEEVQSAFGVPLKRGWLWDGSVTDFQARYVVGP